MNKSVLAVIFSVVAATSLSGCVVAVGGDRDGDGYSISSHESHAERNRRHIGELMLDMPIERVKQKMGVADFNEVYKKNDETVQVLFYRTQRVHKDDLTTKDECTPLLFKKGVLVGWGQTAYNQM